MVVVRLIVLLTWGKSATELEEAVKLSVGGGVASVPQLLTSKAPSTDPSPVARL